MNGINGDMRETISLTDIDEQYSKEEPEKKSIPEPVLPTAAKNPDILFKYGLHIVLLLAIFIIICIIYNAPNYCLTFFSGAALLLLGWLAIH